MQLPPAKLRPLRVGWLLVGHRRASFWRISVGFPSAGHCPRGAVTAGKWLFSWTMGKCHLPLLAGSFYLQLGGGVGARGPHGSVPCWSPLGWILLPSIARGWFLLPNFATDYKLPKAQCASTAEIRRAASLTPVLSQGTQWDTSRVGVKQMK